MRENEDNTISWAGVSAILLFCGMCVFFHNLFLENTMDERHIVCLELEVGQNKCNTIFDKHKDKNND
jgi:hypothetical protein